VLTLRTPLEQLKYIGPRYASKLKRLGIFTIQDLLWHFPSRYEDFSNYTPIADLEPGSTVTLRGTVVSCEVRRSFRKRLTITEVVVADSSGEIRAVWFNQPYLRQTLYPGRLINISGKVKQEGDDLVLAHPGYELLNEKVIQEEQTRHTGRLVPIYPSTKGLTSRALRFFIQPLLENLPPPEEWLPKEVLRKLRLPEIHQALKSIHFPENIQDAERARERFIFENLFVFHLFNMREKLRLNQEQSIAFNIEEEWIDHFYKSLPFELTNDQRSVSKEIINDLKKDHPMNRLLQGDVGSGKTVIAALAAYLASRNNLQAAFMAPTEVLATQHFSTLKKVFSALPREKQPSLALLTSSKAMVFYENDLEQEVTKDKLKAEIEKGAIQILIGTHSLIEKDVRFQKLGLLVIDEQHRFGVAQRAALSRGGRGSKKNILPHLLSMSATPIPRTLMLSLFGDLDVSLIHELPQGRKPIVTKVVAPENRPKAYGFVKEHLKAGRQAFIICPRIEASGDEILTESDKRKLDVRSVKEEYDKLSQKIFPQFTVQMLHGQMKAKEKNEVMNQFQKGKIDLLVSTSVIEVGVDVPNATVMVIESAERFGLAQLYQFRGRVGRGTHQSYCLLFSGSESESTIHRLEALTTAQNGFELAEIDLKLRGPGQFLGTEQTGLPDELMSYLQNMELISQSLNEASSLIKKDPQLDKHPLLKERILFLGEKLHRE